MSEAAGPNYETREAVAAKLESCMQSLLKNDSNLLTLDVNERTVTQRLASYMEGKFPSWHVDCEYNRLRDEVKRLELRAGIVPLVPDIILHVRDSDENLLVIEAKKDDDPRGEDRDIERLHAFKQKLGYTHAVLLILHTGRNPRIEVRVWI